MERNEIQVVEANFRASNFLSVAQLFLKSNVNINKLKQEDLKEKVFGHWGCCPGINYFYAHLNRFIRKTKIVPNIIIGTGHGSPALISNLYINGSLGKMYPKYKYGLEGINNLISDFGNNMILQTEISPLLPGVILAGGELGNAISVSLGTVINNPKQTTLTIVGDGEFEAGTTLSSLLCNQLINSKNDGFLVIMINLNGYKMTSRSLISLNENFAKLLESFGYEVFNTSINDHEETVRIFDEIANRQKKWYEGEKTKIPIVILKSPKGFSAPETIDGLAFTNSHLSHKVSTLKIPKDIKNSVKIIKKWLMSYKPESLFVNGVPSNMVLENIPKIKRNNVEKNIRNAKRININNFPSNGMKALSKYFIESTDEDFLIFSPDESISNGLNDFVDQYGIRYNSEIDSSIRVKEKGRIVEILNEVICITMLYGYLNSGEDGVFITYEAFSPLVSSFLSQCYKFYKQQNEGNVKEIHNSLKIIITSLGWRNTYTHQNPDLLNTLLSKESEYVKIYFPSESKQAILCFEEMKQAKNSIQVLYLTKTEVNTYRTMEQAKADVKRGYWIKKFKNSNSSNKILLIAIGDIITNECLKVSELISDINIDVLSIIKSDCLQKLNIDIKKYYKVLVYCTGYCDIIRGELSKMFDTTKWLFKGYNDSIYGTYKNVLESNGIDIQSIIKDIKEDYYEL